ncbi:MAG: MBL fold metallo-hydrolase [Oscillospiraceae bacterium]|jgi:glyoxylase-like metal-dependent hydrolase (beta-lactamase superfamily II)|nr:MBL fold metallo-hydrolase [Oscillospiraceae bacterium]
MLIKTLPVGQLETNCYVVTDENALVCAVIDPGDESNTILDYIEDNKLSCKAILITHAHFDHVSAVNAMLEATGAELYMCEKDLELAKTGASGRFTPPENTHFYKDGDEVKVAGLTFKVMETPGHTPGGVTLICGDALFTGDTLFRGSCGRTDLPGGDMRAELRSLKRIASLEGDYEVYPGHAESSMLSIEREHNPYVRHALEKM